MSTRRPYPTDLSDDEWEILKSLIPEAKPGGRPRAHQPRELLNAIFYVVRGGCAWRLLPGRRFARGLTGRSSVECRRATNRALLLADQLTSRPQGGVLTS